MRRPRWHCRPGPLPAPGTTTASVPAALHPPPPPGRRRPGSAGLRDRPRGVDQADVAEGLGEVAEQLSRRRVDLLGEQAEVVAVAGRGLEDLAGPVGPAGERERLGEPESAEEESAPLARQPVAP